jgi:hypothetical protein
MNDASLVLLFYLMYDVPYVKLRLHLVEETWFSKCSTSSGTIVWHKVVF